MQLEIAHNLFTRTFQIVYLCCDPSLIGSIFLCFNTFFMGFIIRLEIFYFIEIIFPSAISDKWRPLFPTKTTNVSSLKLARVP